MVEVSRGSAAQAEAVVVMGAAEAAAKGGEGGKGGGGDGGAGCGGVVVVVVVVVVARCVGGVAPIGMAGCGCGIGGVLVCSRCSAE